MTSKMFRYVLFFASLLAGASNAVRAAPPAGTVERKKITAIDNRPIHGIGFNVALVDLEGDNPFGAYYKTLVQEGWIYRVKYWDLKARKIKYYWAYSWNGEGEMAPYDITRQFNGMGSKINAGH